MTSHEGRRQEFPVPVDTEYRVFFETASYGRMKEHAATTTDVELCGVLIGDVCHDGVAPFLKIIAAVPGEGTNNYGSQVTFTHETWNQINRVKDKQYPEEKIVGWYHTHPGFGIFLSQMDSFIQENFFNLPSALETIGRQESRWLTCS